MLSVQVRFCIQVGLATGTVFGAYVAQNYEVRENASHCYPVSLVKEVRPSDCLWPLLLDSTRMKNSRYRIRLKALGAPLHVLLTSILDVNTSIYDRCLQFLGGNSTGSIAASAWPLL